MGVSIGEPAPGFTLTSNTFEQVSLRELRGRPVVLVFVPMAFSPTCQGEYCALRDEYAEFRALDATVLGISVDSRWVLRAWAQQHGFPFPLLSDFHPKGAVARAYGVWNEDAGYADRATFIVDEEGIVRDVIRSSLKVPRDPGRYRDVLAGLG